MARDLLFEIGVEEIPARFMAGSISGLVEAAKKALTEARLDFENVRGMGTPRRLTLFVDGLAEQQKDLKEEIKGPARKAAFDAEGSPTRALEGFLRSKGLSAEDITIRALKGGEYVFAVKEEKGESAMAILPELLAKTVLSLKFPKPMRWSDHDLRFIRPIHWIVALFGEEIVPVRIVDVESGRVSRSHRFYGSGDVVIENPGTYVDQLRENYVMVDPEERRAVIKEQIAAIEREHHVLVEKDEELLDEVVFLLEYPTALMGSFEEKYLRIPKEAVITPMKEHQRYFPVTDENGNLLPHFVTVRNGLPRHIDIVTAGNEKVLRARLADAEFFYDEDLKIDLGSNVERLKPIVFHITMGTLYEKVERMVDLAGYLAKNLGADEEKARRGAYLAKADLVSNMVYEFPELQGIMGEYYSVAQGEDVEVGRSIRESYMPRFAGDDLPESLLGMIVSIADKIDSVVGFFSMDLEPTGSQDPYALRRQAMGITQIILNGGLTLDFGALVDVAYAQIAAAYETKKSKEETKERVYAFMAQRLNNVLSDEGLSYDTVNAVMSDTPDDFCLIRRKGEALEAFRGDADFEPLMAGFTRVNNLAKNAESAVFDESLLTEDAERQLVAAGKRFKAELSASLAKDDFKAAFSAIAALRAPIDAFLTDIMVMCDDEALKASRLGLLRAISDDMLKAADFTQIVMAK
ncbi:MAG: glycine--tRNA ligase subunit beta [Bacillota bacterium]|jgi:glycyl-tRNA synthetase beta chain